MPLRLLELEFRGLDGTRIRLNNEKLAEMNFELGTQVRIGEGIGAFSLRKDAISFLPTQDTLRVRIPFSHPDHVNVITMNLRGCNLLEWTLDDCVTETVGSGRFNIRLEDSRYVYPQQGPDEGEAVSGRDKTAKTS